MRRRVLRDGRTLALIAAAVLPASAFAQQGLVTFEHFKKYTGGGQWQQELVGYRDGEALGPPAFSTTCTSNFDPQAAPAVVQAANGAAASCTTAVLVDTAAVAAFQTVCRIGAGVARTVRTQLRAVDDRTIALESRLTMPGHPGRP